MSPDQKKKFEEVQFVVEADDFAIHALWREFVDHHKRFTDEEWKQEGGILVTVGQLNMRSGKSRQICMAVQFVTIRGVRIAFYHGSSELVDHKMIEKWWDEHCCPMYDNGQRKARTDATNFHQCYHFILDQNKTAV